MDYNADNILFHCKMYWSLERLVCWSTVRSKSPNYFLKCRRWLDENSPLCPVMRNHNLTNTFIFSHANLSLEDLILLTCTAIKLELFLELIAVAARLGSELIFSEQNPFCTAVFAQHLAQSSPAVWLRTLRSYCSIISNSNRGKGVKTRTQGSLRILLWAY